MELGTFAQRMTHARTNADLNQSELSRQIGCTPQAISSMESESAGGISVTNLFKVADALGVSPRWLATGEHDDDIRPATFSPAVMRIARSLDAMTPERLQALSVVLGIKL